ncbi:MAG: FtsH protease activity modulator HflK [Synergistaceae bacterium]|jgi:membrane protease subunit HflK|nr:FtsH protease activity modulator HflK [Synergistaceae bacterium]
MNEENKNVTIISNDGQESDRNEARESPRKSKWSRFLRFKEFISRFMRKIRKLFDFGSKPKTNSAWEDIKKAFRHINPAKAIWLLIAGIFCVYVMTGIYVVNPGEQAVIKRFGALKDQPVGEGIHYRFPWPVDEVQKINVSEVRRADVGISLPEHMHDADSPETVQLLTGDENIIMSQAIVHYRVKDVAKFLYNVNTNDEQLVRNSVEAALVEVFANVPVDDVLSIGKVEAQNAIVQKTQDILDLYNSGIQVTVFNIQAIIPPNDVANAFRDVTTAREDKEKQINQAQGYYNSVIPGARGKANQQTAQAEANSIEAINTAKGEAGRFAAMLAEYQNNSSIYSRDTTRYRLFLETFERIFPKAKKFIIDSENQNIDVTLIDPNLAAGVMDTALPGR